jgi:pimeloyl-ACP methyl ester carboxylesterase
VIAYDRLGFGKSDPYPGQLGIDFIREEAQVAFPALCDQLEFDRFVGFGHSVGGGMAIAAAAAFPARCQAVVTESAQAFVERRTTESISDAKRAFAQESQLDRLKKYHGDKAEWVLNAWIETWLSPAFAGWNLDEDLAGVQCPVLAIHGENDEYGSVAHPERIGALARGPATVAILRACGHVPHREKEAAVTRCGPRVPRPMGQLTADLMLGLGTADGSKPQRNAIGSCSPVRAATAQAKSRPAPPWD